MRVCVHPVVEEGKSLILTEVYTETTHFVDSLFAIGGNLVKFMRT